VIAYIQQAGFKVTRTYNNRLLIDVKGTVGMAEKAFHLQINNYRSPGGRQFYAPTTDPIVPASLASIIQSIVGLDNATFFTHSPLYATKSTHVINTSSSGKLAHATASSTASSIDCVTQNSNYYTPSQLAGLYGSSGLNGLYTAGYKGEGQTVALLEFDSYIDADISSYYASCTGTSISPGVIQPIAVDGGVATPGNGALQVETDMELVLSTAPHLASLRVYEVPNNNTTDLIDAWNQIIADKVPVVSTGWGVCEADTAPSFATMENNLFAAAYSQGQLPTILAASGDMGNNACGNGTASVNDPASQPYVTGVGGTSLNIYPKGTHAGEKVWNDGQGHASGGGVSSLWTQPSWQQGPGVIESNSSSSTCAANTGNTGNYCREVPDVSFNADPNVGYPIYCTVAAASCSPSSPWIVRGGTSAAASMWAALITLVNQKSLHDGNTVLGFLNPLLYSINQNSSKYNLDFQDVQSGTNSTPTISNGYPAGANYDMVTGLGSYKALPLANDLEQLALNRPPIPTVTPTITPTTTTTVTPTITTTPPPSPTPVSMTWYFAEGKVGGGFTEYITIENPDPVNDCSVNLQYLLGGSNNPAPKMVPVPHASRFTESVNSDLGTPSNLLSYKTVSTIVTVNSGTNCKGVVAERPMYFTNFQGVNSGSDVLGATHPGKSFYFADIPTKSGENSFITILNPPGNSQANVTATYYDGGQQCNTQSLVVQPSTRGTIIPGTATQASCPQGTIAQITSDQAVVIERPAYFSNIPAGNAGTVSGAASVVGAPNPASEWLFAEGYTGSGFQEFLKLANFGTTSVTAKVLLEFTNGHTEMVSENIQPLGQTVIDVNAILSNNTGTCDSTPCQPTQEVSADVSAPNNIVAEREMFFHYNNGHGLTATGVTDVTGKLAPSASAYSFAEGYTNTGYDEWLTLQNPTANSEMIKVTLVNEYGQLYTQTYPVMAHSRFTISITSLVLQNLVHPGGGYQDYEVSMTVQSTNGSFVAERPMYWNASGTQGGSDVIGYIGG